MWPAIASQQYSYSIVTFSLLLRNDAVYFFHPPVKTLCINMGLAAKQAVMSALTCKECGAIFKIEVALLISSHYNHKLKHLVHVVTVHEGDHAILAYIHGWKYPAGGCRSGWMQRDQGRSQE